LFKPEQLLNDWGGGLIKAGWRVYMSVLPDKYRPRRKRGPNSVSRWFDFTSSKRGGQHA